MQHELPVYLIPPPYERAQLVEDAASLSSCATIPRGTILSLRPLPLHGREHVEQATFMLGRLYPRSTLALWLDLITRDEAADLACWAHVAGVRVVIARPTIEARLLRRQLTQLSTFGEDVLRWCRARAFLDVNGEAGDAIVKMAQDACSRHESPGAARGSQAGLRRTILAFSRPSIGSPGQWRRALHAVCLAIQIQRQVDRTIPAIAAEYEYHDDAGVRRVLRRVIGATPTHVRRLLGWEWMLADALHRTAGLRLGRGFIHSNGVD